MFLLASGRKAKAFGFVLKAAIRWPYLKYIAKVRNLSQRPAAQ